MKKRAWGLSTRAIHSGGKGLNPAGAHVHPIFQTANFDFPDLKTATGAFLHQNKNFIYSRLDNPTQRYLEKRLAELDNGKAAVTSGCGMLAISGTLRALLRAGDHIIASSVVYGCTDKLFSDIFPDHQGIGVSFIDIRDPGKLEEAIKENTRLIFIETPANPTMDLIDIRAVAKVAKAYNLLLVVDNTFATPYNQRPLELGADLVIYSLTKFHNGHSDVLGGVTIGSQKLIQKIKDVVTYSGEKVLDPFACFLILRGLETFSQRMKVHNKNALRLARFLEYHPMVQKVHYPGLKSNPQYLLASKQMAAPSGKPGYGGMLSFELKGDIKEIEFFVDYIIKHSFVKLSVSLGGSKTLICVPARMTHVVVPPEKRLEKGIKDELVRVSVGLEDWQDIKKAFTRALNLLAKRRQ